MLKFVRVFITCAVMLLPLSGWAAEKFPAVATGEAGITEGDIERARAAARVDALKNAVRDAVVAEAGELLELGREDPWRRWWIAGAALTVLALLAFVPSQVDRIRNTPAALVTQTRILDELHDLAPRARCATVSVPNRRAVPQLALWTDRRPGEILSAQETGRYAGSSFVPASPEVARQFVLDARDQDKALPPARAWQAPAKPNMTGTREAYKPAGALEAGGKRAAATGDYEAWSPN